MSGKKDVKEQSSSEKINDWVEKNTPLAALLGAVLIFLLIVAGYLLGLIQNPLGIFKF